MPAVAFAQLERHRSALMGHCYRMLGSVVDAEDAVQESLLRAWKGVSGFNQQSSLKTWLYRIATNVCLDLIASEKRRLRPVDLSSPVAVCPDLVLTQRDRHHWVEPIPDALALPHSSDPQEQEIMRESIRLAFVAALQYLPPRQRAVLLLTQVLSFSADETAESLDMSVPAVTSALQRARATLDARNPVTTPQNLSPEQHGLLARYVDAFQRYDITALSALLHDDVEFSMPPYELWLQGPESVSQWLLGPAVECQGSRLIPVAACGGSPAFAQYHHQGATPFALVLLEVRGDKISSITSFLDTQTLFPRFGLPMQWSERSGDAPGASATDEFASSTQSKYRVS
jgi:RNA polymerase sigma-70 factor (ECF subfamily)